MNRLSLIVVVSIGVGLAVTRAPAQESKASPKAAEADKVVRAYDIESLLERFTDYPFIPSEIPTTGYLAESEGGSGSAAASFGGGAGGFGGGMGGGGMGGGGGAFSLPAEGTPDVLRQFGAGRQPAKGAPANDEDRQAERETFYEFLNGELETVKIDGLDVKVMTKEAQKRFEARLAEIRAVKRNWTVTVDAHWLLLDANRRAALQATREGQQSALPTGLSAGELARVAFDPRTIRGTISCMNGQQVHLSTGQRQQIVVGAVPTVGVASTGITPITKVLHVGAVLQIRPKVDDSGTSALVDFQNVVTHWKQPGKPIAAQGKTSGASLDQPAAGDSKIKVDARDSTTTLPIDRFNIGTLEWKSTMRVPVGRPFLAGSATMIDEGYIDSAGTTVNGPLDLCLVLTVRVDKP